MAELTWKERKAEWTATVQGLLDQVIALIDTVPVTDIRKQYRDAAKPLPDRMAETLALYQNEVDMAHEMLLYRLRNYRNYLRGLVENKFYGTGEVKSLYTPKTLKCMGLKASPSGNTGLGYLSKLGKDLRNAETALQDSVDRCTAARMKLNSLEQICREAADETSDPELKTLYNEIATQAAAEVNRLSTTVGKYAGSMLYNESTMRKLEDLLNKTS